MQAREFKRPAHSMATEGITTGIMVTMVIMGTTIVATMAAMDRTMAGCLFTVPVTALTTDWGIPPTGFRAAPTIRADHSQAHWGPTEDWVAMETTATCPINPPRRGFDREFNCGSVFSGADGHTRLRPPGLLAAVFRLVN